MKKKVVFLFLLFSILFLFSGCVLLGEAALEMGLAEEAAGIGIAEGELATLCTEDVFIGSGERTLLNAQASTTFGEGISSRAAFSELTNVRLVEQPFGKPPRLSVLKNGVLKEPFAEVIDNRTLKFLKGGGETTLHNEIYAIRGESVKIWAKPNPTTNIDYIGKTLTTDNGRIVVKLAEKDGWYKVLIGKERFGWISGNDLRPVILYGLAAVADTIVRNYYTDGTVKERYRLKYGKLDGSVYSFDRKGNKTSSKIYIDGVLSEVKFIIGSKGDTLPVGTLKKGNGTLNIYDENENLVLIHHYQGGILKKRTFPPPVLKPTKQDFIPEVVVLNSDESESEEVSYDGFNKVTGTMPSTSLSGNIVFSGVVQGNLTIKANSNLVISEESIIYGDVYVKGNSSLTVYGLVTGTIYKANGKIEVRKNGKVTGGVK